MQKTRFYLTWVAAALALYMIGCYAWMGAEWYFLRDVTFNRVDCGVAAILACNVSKEAMMIYRRMVGGKRGKA